MLRPARGFKTLTAEGSHLRAVWDGKPKRCPKRGEYFISGAIPISYRAKQDMTVEYFIAVLVGDWPVFTEPCTSENQITYEYFCVLGGLTHPRARKVERRNGMHVYFTYHYLRR